MSDLEVAPTELAFNVKPDAYATKQLRLYNRGSKSMAFKIKTTNPKQYFVRPNQGIVTPGSRTVIHVMMGKVAELPKEKCKDRFLVQSAAYEGPDVKNDKFEWKSWYVKENFPNGDIPTPVEVKLKCSYILPSDDEPAATKPPRPVTSTSNADDGLKQRHTTPKPSTTTPAPSPAPTVKATPDKSTGKITPVSPPTQTKGPAYTVWIIIAIMFFLLGRYTTHVAIPGTDL